MFDDLVDDYRVLAHLKERGYTFPTKVQAKSIPVVKRGSHIVVRAQTGTGKTYAYLMGVMEKINTRLGLQCLVVVPTKELAMQVKKEAAQLVNSLDIRVAAFFGGKPTRTDENLLMRKNQIVIATPGRLIDYINSRKLRLSELKWLVLDEMDKLLEMGFLKDVEYVIRRCPKLTQILLYSATVTEDVTNIADYYMDGYVTIEAEESIVNEKVIHFCVRLAASEKKEMIMRVLEREKADKCIIFCNQKRIVDFVGNLLLQAGMCVKTLHGDLESIQRKHVIDWFRQKGSKILVGTDLVSRGLHIPSVDLVVNYDVPLRSEDYVHRVGRTGRGRRGRVVTFVTDNEKAKLSEIVEYIGKVISPYSPDA